MVVFYAVYAMELRLLHTGCSLELGLSAPSSRERNLSFRQ